MTTEDDLIDYVDALDHVIEHHGVKGQKWGVRKRRGDRSSFRKAAEAKKAGELRRKPVSSLTNKQLKTINERMNLEQNYRRMNPNKAEKGKKVAKEILSTVGIATSVLTLATTPAGKAAIAAGKKILEPRRVAKVAKLLSNSGPG